MAVETTANSGTSTMKVEYMTACAAIQEIVWIRGVTTELGLTGFHLSKDASPTILNMGSKSAIDLTQNPVNHKRSRHIRIKYHCIREQVGGNMIRLIYTNGRDDSRHDDKGTTSKAKTPARKYRDSMLGRHAE